MIVERPSLWDIDELDTRAPEGEGEVGSLLRRYVVPPFTVLDSRQGYWQDRKRQWLALGIQSELGRSAKTYHTDEWVRQKNLRGLQRSGAGDTSLFDPVLCELAYRWYCPVGGSVLDPFAGGSVRGIVASVLGLDYLGIDLSAPQIAANEDQASRICQHDPRPVWLHGDSRDLYAPEAGATEERFDLLFSCPPYADLEVYGDDPRDLSVMDSRAFLQAYRDIISGSVSLLRPDRFVVWVIGDVRDARGTLRDLPGDTIRAFRDAGASLYNDHILLTTTGSLPVRVSRQFAAGRKAGRAHQLVYVFVKGDAKRAVAACDHLGPEITWRPGA